MADSVIALIYDVNARLLCSERLEGSLKGKMLPPGGKIEPNEMPVPAIRRELQEETGLIANDVVLVGMELDLFGTSTEVMQTTFIYHINLFENGKPEVKEPETHGPWLWLTAKEIKAQPDCDLIRRVLAIVERQNY